MGQSKRKHILSIVCINENTVYQWINSSLVFSNICNYQTFILQRDTYTGHITMDMNWFQLKLLLHPIVCVYTRKCAANIVEKYERSLVVG